jgi:hypothetical protein
MAEADVVDMPERAPLSITIEAAQSVRFTPNEIRALKAETGRSLTELLGPEADDGDRMQTLVWLRLLRDGRGIAWDECGDVAIEVQVEPPDPSQSGP